VPALLLWAVLAVILVAVPARSYALGLRPRREVRTGGGQASRPWRRAQTGHIAGLHPKCTIPLPADR